MCVCVCAFRLCVCLCACTYILSYIFGLCIYTHVYAYMLVYAYSIVSWVPVTKTSLWPVQSQLPFALRGNFESFVSMRTLHRFYLRGRTLRGIGSALLAAGPGICWSHKMQLYYSQTWSQNILFPILLVLRLILSVLWAFRWCQLSVLCALLGICECHINDF